MIRRALALSLLLGPALLFALPASAQTPAKKNAQLSEYAKLRPRAQSGRFVAVPAGYRAIRAPMQGTAFGNPSSTGQSHVAISFSPATSRRPGSLSVKIPEYYMGTTLGGTSSTKQLYTQDLQRRTAVLSGTLTLGRHSRYTAYGPATFTGTIAPGTTISGDGLKQALRGLFVNPLSVDLKPAK